MLTNNMDYKGDPQKFQILVAQCLCSSDEDGAKNRRIC